MANPTPMPEASAEDEQEFLDQGEVAEEVVDEGAEPMSEDDMDEDDDGVGGEDTADVGAAPVVDDSVQGFFEHRESVFAVAVHPSVENLVVSGGGNDKSYLWRLDSGEKVFDLAAHSDSVSAVGFSSDGQSVASGGLDGKVFVFNAASGELVNTLEGPSEITWLDWHPRGNVILVGSEDATMWMWQVPSGNCLGVFSGHVESVTSGQFTPDGKMIVSASTDGSFAVWNPKTATTTLRLTAEDARFHSGPITASAVHKDSMMVLTGAADGTARLIHLGNGRILASLDTHSDSIESIDFCKTMPWAATGSVDGTIGIWDITTMRLRQTLRHDDAVTKVIWHETSPTLTSSSTDGTVRVWDARTGECLKTWRGHQAPIMDLAVTRDGRVAVSAGDDGACLVFSM